MKDHLFEKNSNIAKQPMPVALGVAISQTDRLFFAHKPGYGFYLHTLDLYCHTLAGAVTCAVAIVPNSLGMIGATAISVHSTPEQLAITACKAFIADTVVEKSAATAITFSAGHVVSAGKYGVVAIQMDKSGTVSSKVPAATQTYVTAGQALAALPTPDSGKIILGYLVIQAKSGTAWTANTDDMTAASDLQTITIVNTAAVTRSATGATFVTKARAPITLGAESTRRGTLNDTLLLLYTSDGSGALTNGVATVTIRPRPLRGEY